MGMNCSSTPLFGCGRSLLADGLLEVLAGGLLEVLARLLEDGSIAISGWQESRDCTRGNNC